MTAAEQRAGMASRLRSWWTCRLNRHRSRRDAARGFDMTWLRWLTTVGILAAAVCEPVFGTKIGWPARVITCLPLILLILYFCHIFFRRLQFSLVEWMMLIAVTGNVEGIVLTTPGMGSLPLMSAPIGGLVLAWALYGAVMGRTYARLLGVERGPLRVVLLLAGMLFTAAPAAVVGGAILWILRANRNLLLVSDDMARWIAPLLIAGGICLILRFWLSWRTSRAAKAILGETAPVCIRAY